MEPEDNSLNQGYGTSSPDNSLESGGVVEPQVSEPPQRNGFTALRYNRTALIFSGIALSVIVLIGVGSLILAQLSSKDNQKAALTGQSTAADYGVSTLKLAGLTPAGQLQVGKSDYLVVNGQLQANDTLVLTPTVTPTSPTAGQIYYNQASNQPYYYNGTSFVSLTPSASVTSLGGTSGVIGIGNGLQVTGSQLSLSAALLQQVAAGVGNGQGVSSLQGITGAVTLNAGTGIGITGTTITNTGITSLTAGSGISVNGNTISNAGVTTFTSVSGNLVVSNDGNGNYTIQDTSAGGGGVGELDTLAGILTLANSTGVGTTVTINDASTGGKGIAEFNGTNFTVVGGVVNTAQAINTGASPTFNGLTLTSPLTVPNGGTGANTFTSNGILYGNSTGAIQVTASAANSVLATVGSNPTLVQTLPTAVQGNITQTGTLGSGSIGNGFGTISTTNNIVTTSTVQGGSLTITGGNFTVDSFGNVVSAGTLTVQGTGGIDLGTSSNAGQAVFTNTSNTHTTTLKGLASASQSQTITIPASTALTDTVCLETLANCSGVSGVASLDLLSGALSLANSSGLGGTITIDNATTAAKGIAEFNGTNFTVVGGVVNTIQDIDNSASPSFDGLTLGAPSSVTGNLVLDNVGNSNTTTLQGVASGTQSQLITIPASTSLTDTVCLETLGNCSSGGGITGTGVNGDIAKFTGAGTIADSGLSESVSTLTYAGNAVINAGAGFSGNLLNLEVGSSSKLHVDQAGNLTASGTINGASITSSTFDTANISGGTLSGGTVSGGTLTGAAVNGLNVTSSAIDTASPGTLTIGGSNATVAIGSSANALTLQGDSGTTLTASDGSFTTTVGFTGAATASQTYQFDQTAAAGTYDICTTAGNCAGTGGGIVGAGTNGDIAKFTGAGTIANSGLSESGSTLTYAGNAVINAGSGFVGNLVNAKLFGTSEFTVDQAGNVTVNGTVNGSTITSTSFNSATLSGGSLSGGNVSGGTLTNTSVNSLNVSGTAISGTGALTIDANGTSNVSIGATSTGDILLGGGSGSTGCTVTNATGNFACTGTINGATISAGTLSGGNVSGGTLTGSAVNGLNVGANSIDTSSAGALSIGASNATVTVGAAANDLTLQGNSSTTVVATGGGFTTTLGYKIGSGGTAPTGNVTYQLENDSTVAPGTYTICSTIGNCAGAGGGITGSGTSGDIAKFNGAGTITNSNLSESGTTLTYAGNAIINAGSGFTGNLVNAQLFGTSEFSVNQVGNVVANGTINGATISGGTISGGTLTGSAVDGLNVSGTAISGTGALNIDANGSNQVSIGSSSTGDILLGGGSGSTGCTVTNSNGNLTCAGTINGATISGGTLSSGSYSGATITGGTISGGTLTTTAVDSLNVSGTAISGTGALTIDANGTSNVSIGATSTGDILLGGGSGSTGCTVTNATGNFACTGTINGATISAGTLSGGNVSGGTLTGSAVNGLNVGANSIDTSSAGALSIGASNATVTVGAAANDLTLQGNSSTTVVATGGGFTTTLGYKIGSGGTAPTGNVTYQLENDSTVTPGTYTICTSEGNCAAGGITGSGTSGDIAKFNTAGTITNSNLSESGTTLTYAGNAIINAGSGFTGNLVDLQLNGSSKFHVDQAGNVTATGTINGATVTSTSFNTATVTGGSLTGGSFSAGSVSGGTLTGTAVDGLNVSGTAISGTGALTIDGSGANTISIGASSTGDILLGGGSGSTGCTVTNATGNFACSGTINGASVTSTTFNTATISGGTLTTTAVDSLNVSGTAISGTGALTIDANGTSNVSIGATSTGDILLGGGSGSTGCTVTNSNGNLTCAGTINGATITGGTLSSGSYSGATITGGTISGGTLTGSAVNGLNVGANSIDTSSAGALSIGASNATVTVGAAANDLTLQGNSSTTVVATGGGFTTTLGYKIGSGGTAPTGNVTYQLENDSTVTPGTYTICTSEGNCAAGGITGSGTSGDIAKFNTAGTITNSNLSESGSTLTYAGNAIINAGSGFTGNLVNAQLFGTSEFTVDQSGNLTANGTINGSTITSTTFNTATISGGTLTGTAVDGLNVSGTAISGTGALTINANAASTVSIGGTSTGDILLGGGSGSTGCTVTNSNGNFTCTGTLQGAAATVTGLSSAGIVTNTSGGVLGTESTVPVANGGTNISSYTVGDLLYASGTTTLAKLSDVGVGACLISEGVGVAPGFGSCTGAGGGVTGSGTPGDVAIFNGSGSITNSGSLSESGTTVTSSGNVVIQGSNSLTLGTSTSADGSIAFNDAAGTHTVTLQAPATDPTSNVTFYLPSADGGNGDCLQTDGAGNLSFQACTGGAGGGVTTIDSQAGILLLDNSSGSAGHITINDASTAQKGIAEFNSTNFSANSGTIDTIQDIATTSSPTFVTINGTTGINTGSGSGTQRIDSSGDLVNIGTITTSGAINTATVTGGSLTGGSFSAGSVSGGTLTGTAVDGLNVSGTAISGTGALTIDANGTSNVSIGATSTGDILLGGGSGSTGCTVTNATGNFACTGTINGATVTSTSFNTATVTGGSLTGGSFSAGSVSGGTLTGTAVDGLNVSGTAISGTGALTIDGSGANTISIGASSTGDILLGGGSGSTGCTVTNATGNFACTGTINGATISAGTLSGGNVSGGTLTGSAVNGLNVGANSIDTSSAGALSIGASNATVTVGAAANDLTLQGNSSTTVVASSAGHTTTVGFTGSATASQTYQFDQTAAAGTYDICTTAGNCAGGVTTIDSQAGILLLDNSSGSAGHITINDASTAQKGIAEFNSTNFSANSGTIDTIQDIATTSSPTFVTINGTTGINTGSGSGTQRIDSSGDLVNIGTIVTSGTINTATISGGTLNGGTLTGTAVDGLGVSGTAIAGTGDLTIDASGTHTISIGATSTGDILLGGGSGSTGCTVTNATGNFACSGTINGASVTSTTFNTATISGGTLTTTAVDSLNVSGTAISGTGALTIDANGTSNVSIGATSTGDILLGGGSGSTGCTVTNATGNFACTGTINGATISAGTLSGGNVSGGTLTGSAVNGLNVGANSIDTSSAGALSIGASNATVTVGAAANDLTLQGNSSTTVVATGGGFTTTLGYKIGSGGTAPTGNVTYQLENDSTVTPGTYTICTSEGNCAAGGITGSGTSGDIAKFNTAGTITNSNLSESGTTLTYAGNAIINAGSGFTGNLVDLQLNGSSKFHVDQAGNVTATGTINGATVTSTSFNTATVTGGSLTGGSFSAGSVSGGTLTGTAVDGLNVSGTAISGTGALTIDGSGANTISIGASSTGDILLGGGSGSTGCTVTNATGNFACSGTINGASITGGTLGGGSVTGGTLTASAVDSLNVSGTAISGTSTLSVESTGANALTLDTGGASAVDLGNTNATSVQIGHTTGTVPTVTIQGNSVSVASSNGTNSTTVGFSGTQVAGNINYNFDRTVAAGTYTICTTIGNCAGAGGGITGSGTSGDIAEFSGSGTIGNSGLSEASSVLTYAGSEVINAGSGFTGNLVNAELFGTSEFSVNQAGNVVANGTINGSTITATTFDTATISGGNLSTTAVDGLNVSGTAISGTGALTINASGTNTVSIGGTSSGDILLGGGSGSTGCTITNSNGNLTCTGTINGATITAGTLSGGNVSGGTLTTSAVDSLNVSGTAISGTSTLSVESTGANALTLDTGGASAVDLGNTNATSVQIGHTTGTVPTVTIQGNSVSVASSNGTNSTTVGFSGTQVAGNINYNFDRTVAAGTYTICTTIGNCAGAGGGITGSGTSGDIAKFNGSGTITNSNLSESATTLTYAGNAVINAGSGFTGNLIDLQLNGSSKLSVDQSGDLSSSGTINGATITATTFDTATISGGSLTGGSISGGTISGGTLTGTAVDGLNVSGAAISGTGALTIDGSGTNTISIGGTSTGDILLGGGSGSTGCTVTNASGNLTCTGTINGATITGGTVSSGSYSGATITGGTISGGTLTATAVDNLGVSGTTVTGTSTLTVESTGTNTVTLDTGATGGSTVDIGNTNATTIQLGNTGTSAPAINIQGNSVSIESSNGTNNTTVGFTGTQAAHNITYDFDRTAAAGTYTICTTIGNCSGIGGDITGAGTAGDIAEFTGAGTVGNSAGLSESGSVLTYAGSTIVNAGSGFVGNLTNLKLFGTSEFSVNQAGNVVANGTINTATITGGTLSGTAVDSLNVSGTAISGTGALTVSSNGSSNLSLDTGSTGGTVNVGISHAATIQLGNTGTSAPAINIQGNSVSIESSNGTNNTTVGFTGTQAADNITYNFDRTIAAGTYTICTSIGNCAGSGGGITGSGTSGDIAEFTGAGTIGNSAGLSESGSVLTYAGSTIVNAGSGFVGNLTNLKLFGTSEFSVNQAGNVVANGTINTATITGGTLTGSAVNGLNVSSTAISGTGALSVSSTGSSALTLDTGTSGTVDIGNTNATTIQIGKATSTVPTVNIQGNSSSTIESSNGTNNTTIGFTGTQAAHNITYDFDQTVAAGTYTICTTIGNCAGSGGGITGSGTSGDIAEFTGAGTIGNSAGLSESGSVLTYAGSTIVNAGSGFVGNLTNLKLFGTSEFSVNQAGNVVANGTINGSTITATTFNTATISGGTLSGGNVSGGTLTATAVDGLNVSGTAISGTGALTVDASGTNTISIGATSTGDILLGGGSGSTGCTVTNASGNFACTGTLNGATISGGTISGGTLTTTAVDSLNVSGTAISGTGALSIDANGASNISIGGTSTGNLLLVGGSGGNGCTITYTTKALACAGTINGATISGGTLTSGSYAGATITGGTLTTTAVDSLNVSGTAISGTGALSIDANGASNISIGGTSTGNLLLVGGSGGNGCTITYTTKALACAGTINGATISGGTLSGTAVDSLNVSGTAISGTGALTIDGSGANSISIGATSTGDILLGGGSGSTGCTVTNSTGALTCTSTINGATLTGGTLNGGTISSGTLTSLAVDGLNVSGTAISGTGALTIDASGTNTISIGATSTGDILLGGGSGSTGCTVTNATGALTCASTINGATISGGTLTSGSYAGATITGGTISGGTLTTTAVDSLGVSGTTVTGTSTLSLSGTGTGNVTLDTASAGGTVSVGNANATTVQVGNTTSATTIQGNGTGTAVNIQTAASGFINIATANAANTIQIGNTANAVSQTFNIGNNNTGGIYADNVNIGSLISTSMTTIQGGTNGVGIQTAATGTISIGTANQDTITIGDTAATTNTDNVNIDNTTGANTSNVTIGGTNNTGNFLTQAEGITNTITGSATTPSETVKTSINSATAYQIQNAASDSVLTVQTGSTNPNLITNPSFEIGGTPPTGWTSEGNGTVGVTNTSHASVAFFAVDGNNLMDANITVGAANAGVITNSFVGGNPAAGTYTLSFSARTDTGLTTLRAGYNSTSCSLFNDGGAADSTLITNGWKHFYCTFTAGVAITSIFIDQGATTTTRNIYVDAVQLEAGSAPTPFRSGEVAVNGSLVVNGGTNNTLNTNPVDGKNWALIVNQLNGGDGVLIQSSNSEALGSSPFTIEADSNAFALQQTSDITAATYFNGGSTFWDTPAVNIANHTVGADPLRVEDSNGNDLLSVSSATTNLVSVSNFEGAETCAFPPNWVVKGTISNGVTAACPNGDPLEDLSTPFETLSSLKAVTTAVTSGMQTSNFTTSILPSTSYELTFWAKCSSSIATFSYGRQDVSGTNVNATTTGTCNTTWQQYAVNYTTGGTITNPNIYVDSGATASVTIWLDGVSLVQTATNAAVDYSPGQIYLTGVIASPADFENSANSSEAFQIQNSSSTDIFDVNTTAGYVGIGTNSPTSRLTASWLSGDTTPTAYVGSSSVSDNEIAIEGQSYSNIGVKGVSSSSTGVLGQSTTGESGLFQSTSGTNTQATLATEQQGSSTADLFQAQNSSAAEVFDVGSNGNVGIGLENSSSSNLALNVSGAIQQTGMDTQNTNQSGTNDSGYYAELGNCTLIAQYTGCTTTIAIAGGMNGGTSDTQATVYFSVYQQNAMGSAPIVTVNAGSDTQQILASNLVAVTTVNTAGQTVVELFGQISIDYEYWAYSPINVHYAETTPVFTWTPSIALVASLPAGAQNVGTYDNIFANNVTVTGTISSATALTLQSGTGNVILTGTGNTDIQIGNGDGGTGTSNPDLLVLDDGDTTTDPATEVDGAMYYNTSMASFRCGQNSVWVACTGQVFSYVNTPNLSLAGSIITGFGNTTQTAGDTPFTESDGSTPIEYVAPINDCQQGVTYIVTASGGYNQEGLGVGWVLNLYEGANAVDEDTVQGGHLGEITGIGQWTFNATITCWSTTQVTHSSYTNVDVLANDTYTTGVVFNNGTVETFGEADPMSSGPGTNWTDSGSAALQLKSHIVAGSADIHVWMTQFNVQRVGP